MKPSAAPVGAYSALPRHPAHRLTGWARNDSRTFRSDTTSSERMTENTTAVARDPATTKRTCNLPMDRLGGAYPAGASVIRASPA